MGMIPILALQDDALANQFAISFPQGIPGGGSGEEISLRMDQSFDPPEETVGEYSYYYKGLQIIKPNMLDETDKHLSIQVRLDQQWSVFDDLQNWKKNVHDVQNGLALPFSQVSTTILLQAFDGLAQKVKEIKYQYVWLKGVKIEAFEPGSSDPSRVTLNFGFILLDSVSG